MEGIETFLELSDLPGAGQHQPGARCRARAGASASFFCRPHSSGQLGDGTTTNRLTPVRTGSLTAQTAIAAGYAHGLATAGADRATTAYRYDRLYRLTGVGQPVNASPTLIRLSEMSQLRTDVDTWRQDVGLAEYAWTGPVLTGNTPVRDDRSWRPGGSPSRT